MPADPGRYNVKIPSVRWKLTVTEEHWQFFAFVFGALLTLVYALMDAIPCLWPPRCTPVVNAGAKVAVFAALAWLTLWCWWFKRLLISVLGTIKTRTQQSNPG